MLWTGAPGGTVPCSRAPQPLKGFSTSPSISALSYFLVHSWDFDVFCQCPWLTVEQITVFCYCDRLYINWMQRCCLWEGSSGPRSVEIAKDSGVQTSFARQNCCPVKTFAFITICVLTDLFTILWVNLRSICACWLEKPAGLLEKQHRETGCRGSGCISKKHPLGLILFFPAGESVTQTLLGKPYELLYPALTAKPLLRVKNRHVNFPLGGEHTNGAKIPRGVKRSVWGTLMCLKGIIAKVPMCDSASLKHCSKVSFRLSAQKNPNKLNMLKTGNC